MSHIGGRGRDAPDALCYRVSSREHVADSLGGSARRRAVLPITCRRPRDRPVRRQSPQFPGGRRRAGPDKTASKPRKLELVLSSAAGSPSAGCHGWSRADTPARSNRGCERRAPPTPHTPSASPARRSHVLSFARAPRVFILPPACSHIYLLFCFLKDLIPFSYFFPGSTFAKCQKYPTHASPHKACSTPRISPLYAAAALRGSTILSDSGSCCHAHRRRLRFETRPRHKMLAHVASDKRIVVGPGGYTIAVSLSASA